MIEPTTIEEQIAILRSRGLLVDQDAGRILSQCGYYTLINGYKDPFIDSSSSSRSREDSFLPGSSLKQVFSLYIYDSQIRSNLFYLLNSIEVQMKSAISLHFSLKYGASHWKYLTPDSFTPAPSKRKYVNRLISKIQNDITVFQTKNAHPAICHAMEKYNQIPLWVLNTVLSFGTMSNFYDNLKDDMKKKIAREIHPEITPSQLSSILYFLTKVRNKCAHNNRLYSHKKDQMGKYYEMIPELPVHEALGIPRDPVTNYYKYGQDDLLAVLICASIFASKNHLILVNYDAIEKYVEFLSYPRQPSPLLSPLPPSVISYIREITGFKKEFLIRLKDIFSKK